MDAKPDKHLPKNKAGENHLQLPRPTNAAYILPAIETEHESLSFHHLQKLG